MNHSTSDELWDARRAAIDSAISTICRLLPEWAATIDDWDLICLAVRMADGEHQFAEVDGRIIFE